MGNKSGVVPTQVIRRTVTQGIARGILLMIVVGVSATGFQLYRQGVLADRWLLTYVESSEESDEATLVGVKNVKPSGQMSSVGESRRLLQVFSRYEEYMLRSGLRAAEEAYQWPVHSPIH